jgi:hypothetical protein
MGRKALTMSVCALGAAFAAAAGASQVQVTVENLNESEGFFLTPFWLGFHDGSFDSYDGGALASGFGGITELAEEGDTGPISARFNAETTGVDTTLLAPAGGGPPVFAPGESASTTVDVGDATANRYFSYASMVIPSNDLFVANGNPTAHELFDAGGNFLGPLVIEIFGRQVNDNGTELNDRNGAAFSALGGTATDTSENIRNLFTVEPDDSDYLAGFLGTQTATGVTINDAFGPDDLIARITIVPSPGAAGVLALGGLAAARRRR